MNTARAGSTLIELMVCIAILSIAATMLAGHFELYQRAGHRARAVTAVAEVLNQEMEAARACASRRCLTRLAATASTAFAQPEAAEWIRPTIVRTLADGPDGTFRYEVTATVGDVVPPRRLVALIEVAR